MSVVAFIIKYAYDCMRWEHLPFLQKTYSGGWIQKFGTINNWLRERNLKGFLTSRQLLYCNIIKSTWRLLSWRASALSATKKKWIHTCSSFHSVFPSRIVALTSSSAQLSQPNLPWMSCLSWSEEATILRFLQVKRPLPSLRHNVMHSLQLASFGYGFLL